MGNHDSKVGDCIEEKKVSNKQTNSNFIDIDTFFTVFLGDIEVVGIHSKAPHYYG